MKSITPLMKGLITGAVMLITTLIFYYTNQRGNSGLQYVIYAMYAAGIIWTLFSYAKNTGGTAKFGALFLQGFRCFVVVTLMMVTITAFFSIKHPEMAEESSVYYKEELVKQKNKTPAEIDTAVADYKKQYTTRLVSFSIFGYLIIGAIFTAGGAALVSVRK